MGLALVRLCEARYKYALISGIYDYTIPVGLGLLAEWHQRPGRRFTLGN
jgi:hypothetical protein